MSSRSEFFLVMRKVGAMNMVSSMRKVRDMGNVEGKSLRKFWGMCNV